VNEKGIYFAKNAFYELIKEVGGEWNDTKFRPLVVLIPSLENPQIFWAIPMGDYNHRSEQQKKRIKSYMERADHDISSCFYHVGNTDKRSIFFVSDVVPITVNYIEREYEVGAGKNKAQYIIKNQKLIAELNRKVGRIISFEKGYRKTGRIKFRQHILGIFDRLEEELKATDED